MQSISRDDIAARISRDNTWWRDGTSSIPEHEYPHRVYFDFFYKLVSNYKLKRAPILLGPRRVGKTVIVKQTIAKAIEDGINPENILYASIDTPIFAGMPLEKFIEFLPNGVSSNEKTLVAFDEIQYLADWQTHLKDLVDSYPSIKFIATGSAAASILVKSKESGAGRFTDFVLPPLTFHEFLLFVGRQDELISESEEDNRRVYSVRDINGLNSAFIEYLNYGGYPEAVLNEAIRDNADQFIKNDVIEKVLLKDLPSLYGIENIQELNQLFSVLAFNTGGEVSLEGISQRSGLSKHTIKRYIEYLESAFLIMKIRTVDENCRTLQRERNFKIYLNNPSMRAALFAPVSAHESDRIGHLAEAAVFSQWQHSTGFSNLRYARWKNQGEVDVVFMSQGEQKPLWFGEIKWSDKAKTNRDSVTKNLRHLARKHRSVREMFLTTRTLRADEQLEGIPMKIMPTALYSYIVGRNLTLHLGEALELPEAEIEVDNGVS